MVWKCKCGTIVPYMDECPNHPVITFATPIITKEDN